MGGGFEPKPFACVVFLFTATTASCSFTLHWSTQQMDSLETVVISHIITEETLLVGSCVLSSGCTSLGLELRKITEVSPLPSSCPSLFKYQGTHEEKMHRREDTAENLPGRRHQDVLAGCLVLALFYWWCHSVMYIYTSLCWGTSVLGKIQKVWMNPEKLNTMHTVFYTVCCRQGKVA